jgi:hypothetical protein
MQVVKMRTDKRFDKFAGSEFARTKYSPQGEGQEARSTNSPGANLNAQGAARRAEGRKPGVILPAQPWLNISWPKPV